MTHDQEVLQHVERPRLPWRNDARTECGLPTAGHPVITRDEFIAKVKRLGQQRSAMSTCMTCWNTAQRWPTWGQDPVAMMRRETQMWKGDPRLRDELVAIAALIEAHRDEFDGLLTGLGQTSRLDEARRARRARVGGER